MVFFFQAEDGIRDLVRSRGLGDVYKRQNLPIAVRKTAPISQYRYLLFKWIWFEVVPRTLSVICLLYTSDAADERSSVDLGGRRIINKKKEKKKEKNKKKKNKNKQATQ